MYTWKLVLKSDKFIIIFSTIFELETRMPHEGVLVNKPLRKFTVKNMGRTGAQARRTRRITLSNLELCQNYSALACWCVSTLGRDDLRVSFSVRMSAFKKRRFQQVCETRNGSNKLIRSCGGQRVCVGRARVSKSLVGRKKFDIDKESVLKPNKLFGIAHCAVMMMYDIVSSGSSVNTITDAQYAYPCFGAHAQALIRQLQKLKRCWYGIKNNCERAAARERRLRI
jgi:hypothetical protein